MVGNKSEGTITFSYDIKELFNDVSLLSAYMTKNIMVGENSALDQFCITDDEEDVFKVCLKQALPNIYDAFLKISTGLEEAFTDNAVVSTKESTGLKRNTGTYVEFNIKDNKAYNKSLLSIVDTTLRDCINYGTLVEFYSVCVNDGLMSLANAKYTQNIVKLNQRLFQLKKKPVVIC